MSEVKRCWIYKGTSNFCEELIPDDNCENMVKQKPDGFYDIVSTADTIEGGVEVVLASDYEKLKAQLERAELFLSFYADKKHVNMMINGTGDDFEEIDGRFHGGKRAREYFKEKE